MIMDFANSAIEAPPVTQNDRISPDHLVVHHISDVVIE
jgi:hypothetical protein